MWTPADLGAALSSSLSNFDSLSDYSAQTHVTQFVSGHLAALQDTQIDILNIAGQGTLRLQDLLLDAQSQSQTATQKATALQSLLQDKLVGAVNLAKSEVLKLQTTATTLNDFVTSLNTQFNTMTSQAKAIGGEWLAGISAKTDIANPSRLTLSLDLGKAIAGGSIALDDAMGALTSTRVTPAKIGTPILHFDASGTCWVCLF